MAKRFVYLFIFFGLTTSCNSFAQNAAFRDCPLKFKIIKQKCIADCGLANRKLADDVSFEYGCALAEGDVVRFKLENKTQKGYYYTLLDIQPDNEINLIYPNSYSSQGDYKITGNAVLALPEIATISPPYGIDKELLIVSETPEAGNRILNALFSGSRGSTSLTKNELLQEITWILQGQSSTRFKDCYFSVMDMAIIPKTQGGTENSNKQSLTHSGLSSFSSISIPLHTILLEEKCSAKIKDPQNLYSVYPLISFMQPLQAGATRGAGAEHETNNKSYVLKGFASALKGIKSVSVNGEKGSLNILTDQQSSWEKEVTLQPGKNLFTVNIVTTEGKENCEQVVLNYNPNSDNVSREGHNYSLFIGINNYVNFNKLSGPKKDATDIKELLQKNYGFDTRYVSELYDESATKENIDSVFRNLISILTPADNLIVYFAGHGVLDKQVNEGYWIPVDARGHKPIDYIANSEIKKYLEALNAKHVVVFADACFSGGFFKTNRGETYADKVDKLRSKWLFCSGREEEVSDLMAGQKNSPFAYYIIKFLKEYSGDGLPTSELAQKVKTAVASNSNQTPIAGAIKETGDEGGEFIFRTKGLHQ